MSLFLAQPNPVTKLLIDSLCAKFQSVNVFNPERNEAKSFG
jgi:hypothetical protein